jgi:hypothetical protein
MQGEGIRNVLLFFLYFCVKYLGMINHVRNTVLTILNKENRGYLTPEQFNLYAQHAQQNIFNLYFSEYSRMSSMKNARRLSQDYGDRVRDLKNKIDRFTKVVSLPKSNSVYLKPCDMYMPLSLRCNGVEVDEVPVYKETMLDNANLCGPSTSYPVYIDKNNSYTVKPDTITCLDLAYVRQPVDPKWTYIMIGGEPIFNSSANDYMDFELGEEEEVALVSEICKLAGVSIREVEVSNIINGLDNQNTQKETV